MTIHTAPTTDARTPTVSSDKTFLRLPEVTVQGLSGGGQFEITGREFSFRLKMSDVREVRNGDGNLVWINRENQADYPSHVNDRTPHVRGTVMISLYEGADTTRIPNL